MNAFTRRSLLLSGAAAAIAGWIGPAGAALPAEDPGTLQARLHGIRAVREVKRLQHAWSQFAEAGQWRDMAALMASDATLIAPPANVKGREAIHAHLRETMGDGSEGLAADRLNIRLMLSPVITVGADGRTAKGRWHEVSMTGRYGHSAEWSGGIHENDYVLTDDGWRIARLHYHPQYAGPYATGWRNVVAETPLVPFHYDPRSAGTPVPLALVSPRQAPGLAYLSAEADVLLAASEVQNLQAAYGFYVDRKMWDDVADLFGPEASFEIVGEGVQRGRSAVRRRLDGFGPAGLAEGELNDHLQLVPVVTVAPDGQSARIRGIELGMVGRHGGASWWSMAIYDNDFVRHGDKWMIRSMRITPRMRADYTKGWERDLPPPAASAYPLKASPPVRIEPSLARPARPGRRAAAAGEVARKLAVAAAYDGAENVSYAYGYYIDEFRWDDTADLFSTDGWKELSYIGTYIGRERVRESLVSRYGRNGRSLVSLAIHQKTQPYVTVSPDGQRAQIRLRLFQVNSSVQNPGSYIDGVYENQVKLEDGVWTIHGMDLDYVWLGNYVGGWAAIEPGSNRRYAPTPEAVAKYPPDAPLRGVTFAPYPEIAPMGFHFRNPVSGRAPAVLLSWSDGRGT